MTLSQTHVGQMAASPALLKSHYMDDLLSHAADLSPALVAMGSGDGLNNPTNKHSKHASWWWRVRAYPITNPCWSEALYLGKGKREEWEKDLLKWKFAKASTTDEHKDIVNSNQVHIIHCLSSMSDPKIKLQQEIWFHPRSIWCLLCVRYLCAEEKETLGVISLTINELESL